MAGMDGLIYSLTSQSDTCETNDTVHLSPFPTPSHSILPFPQPDSNHHQSDPPNRAEANPSNANRTGLISIPERSGVLPIRQIRKSVIVRDDLAIAALRVNHMSSHLLLFPPLSLLLFPLRGSPSPFPVPFEVEIQDSPKQVRQ